MYFVGLILMSVYGLCVADPDLKLLSEGIRYAMGCAAKNAIQFDVCAEMFSEGADFSDAKYEKCKMKDDGTWDEEVMNKIVGNLQSSEWKEEATKVLPMCKDQQGTECEVGFNAFACVMQKSEKARNYVHKLMKAMTGE